MPRRWPRRTRSGRRLWLARISPQWQKRSPTMQGRGVTEGRSARSRGGGGGRWVGGHKGGARASSGGGVRVRELERAVFSFPTGERGEPVKSPFGYHLIQVE